MKNDNFEHVGPVVPKNNLTDEQQSRKMYLFLKFIGNMPFYQTEYECEVVNTLDGVQKKGGFCFNAESESYLFISQSICLFSAV